MWHCLCCATLCKGLGLATVVLGSNCDGESGVRGLQKDSKRQTKLMFGCDAGIKASGVDRIDERYGHFNVQMSTLDQLR